MFNFIVLLIIIVVTMYTALIYDNATIMLVGFMGAVLFVLSFVQLIFIRFMLKAKIEIPVGISETGRPNAVRVRIHNKGITLIKRAMVRIRIEDEIRGKVVKYWLKLPEITPGDNNFVREYTFDSAGDYRFMLQKIRVYDWTNLFFSTIRVNAREVIQVLPVIHNMLVRLTNASLNFYGESDVYATDKSGYDNNEIYKVREYQPGDRLQNVHWKVTAKQDELMVKEGSLPKACPVVLFLSYNQKYEKKDEKLVAFMETAVSVSFALMEAKCPHYVAWYDAKDNELKRIRVDDEESLFLFMGMIMKVKWDKLEESVVNLYKEEYKTERYVFAVSLDEELKLRKNDELIAELSIEHLDEELSHVELVL